MYAPSPKRKQLRSWERLIQSQISLDDNTYNKKLKANWIIKEVQYQRRKYTTMCGNSLTMVLVCVQGHGGLRLYPRTALIVLDRIMRASSRIASANHTP